MYRLAYDLVNLARSNARSLRNRLAYSATLIALAGCSWADQSLQPGPSPIVGYSVGAAVNTGLLVLKRPWYERLGAEAGVAFAGRFTPLFGRKMEGWHLEVMMGGGIAEWISWFKCKGPCQ